MNKTFDVFCEIPCLTEKTAPIKGIVLQKKWFPKADKRYVGQHLQKFIDYNSEVFNFIGVTPFIIGSDQNSSIVFRSAQFIGAIPLRSPDTGEILRATGNPVFEPGCAKSFSDALDGGLTLSQQGHGEMNRRHADREWDLMKTGQQYIALYRLLKKMVAQ